MTLIYSVKANHYYEQAVELRAEGSALLGARSQEMISPPQVTLAPKCLSCNAPLRTDEVEWIHEQRIECVYCGAGVRIE